MYVSGIEVNSENFHDSNNTKMVTDYFNGTGHIKH